MPDVSQFPGHIACDNRSQSEIVTPLINNKSNQAWAVLDIDSKKVNAFTEVDKLWFERIVKLNRLN